MFYAVDLNTVLAGGILGLALGAGIICFLVYAAFRAVRSDGEPHTESRLRYHMSPLSKYETQRAYFNPALHDLDTVDW